MRAWCGRRQPCPRAQAPRPKPARGHPASRCVEQQERNAREARLAQHRPRFVEGQCGCRVTECPSRQGRVVGRSLWCARRPPRCPPIQRYPPEVESPPPQFVTAGSAASSKDGVAERSSRPQVPPSSIPITEAERRPRQVPAQGTAVVSDRSEVEEGSQKSSPPASSGSQASGPTPSANSLVTNLGQPRPDQRRR